MNLKLNHTYLFKLTTYHFKHPILQETKFNLRKVVKVELYNSNKIIAYIPEEYIVHKNTQWLLWEEGE